MSIEWSNVHVKLSVLRPWQQNPRHITRKQAERLAESFSEFGQVETIAIGPDGDVYNGHQRLSVLLKLHGPVYEIDARQSSRALTDDERKKLVVFLHAGAVGGWSWDALSSWEAGDLMQWGFDGDTLQAWKCDIAALGNLIESEETPPVDADVNNVDCAEKLQEKWQTKRGQLWHIGEHTLFVGDAASAGIECDFAIYDPPFDWSAHQQETALSWVTWKNSLLLGLSKCFSLAARSDFNHWWIWDRGCGMQVPFCAPTQSCTIALGFGDKRRFYAAQSLSALTRHSIEHNKFPSQYVRMYIYGKHEYFSQGKPYSLADYIVSLYSQPGMTVGDPFAGSGVFLIACENLRRKYRGAEIVPERCAMILDRWSRTFPDIRPSLA